MPSNDIGAAPESTVLPSEADVPYYNSDYVDPDTGALGRLERIKGKYLATSGGGGGSAGSALNGAGGLFFNGHENGSPVIHTLATASILQRPLAIFFQIRVPLLSEVRAEGRGLGGVSLSLPSSTLNSSLAFWIRGTNTGIGGSAAGDLIAKITTATGGDLDLVVSNFVQDYAGQVVTLLLERNITAVDFPVRLYVKGVKVAEASGTGSDWGLSFGSGAAYFFYGAASSTRPWIGEVLAAGLYTSYIGEAAALGFAGPDAWELGAPAWGNVLSNPNSLMNSAAAFTWNDWTANQASYTESGGGTINPGPPVDATRAWATGMVNSTTAPAKLRLTASATARQNRCFLAAAVAGRKYRVRIKAKVVSGTAVPIYLGFGWDPAKTSQDPNRAEALTFTPTGVEQEYSTVLVPRGSGVLWLGLLNNADAAGQVFDFDDIAVERLSWAVWADLGFGDGFRIPNLSDVSATDGIIPSSSAAKWALPKRNIRSIVRASADQAVSASTALVDTTLTFRVAASAVYAFELFVPFALAGTASGYKFALAGPAAPTAVVALDTIFNSAANSVTEVQADTALGTLILGSLASAATHVLRISGTVENGTTEGDLKLQFAQFVSDAGAITVKRGARMELTRLS